VHGEGSPTPHRLGAHDTSKKIQTGHSPGGHSGVDERRSAGRHPGNITSRTNALNTAHWGHMQRVAMWHSSSHHREWAFKFDSGFRLTFRKPPGKNTHHKIGRSAVVACGAATAYHAHFRDAETLGFREACIDPSCDVPGSSGEARRGRYPCTAVFCRKRPEGRIRPRQRCHDILILIFNLSEGAQAASDHS
jgi:hypothetical protein